jgi:hypothetical protein
MKSLCSIFFLLLSVFTLAQNTDRTVEVTGNASKKFLADKFELVVSVKSGTACEIPSGKNYQKYINECKENNKRLVASREDILKGIIKSFGTKIKYDEDAFIKPNMFGATAEIASEDYSEYNNKSVLLEFTQNEDLHEFMKAIKDYKDAFIQNSLTATCSKVTPADLESLKLESLKDAKRKAEVMAKTLNAELGLVKNIYEEKPMDANGPWSEYTKILARTYASATLSDPSSNVPDDNGYLTFFESSFVRFFLK